LDGRHISQRFETAIQRTLQQGSINLLPIVDAVYEKA
jgi:hypothetical protein